MFQTTVHNMCHTYGRIHVKKKKKAVPGEAEWQIYSGNIILITACFINDLNDWKVNTLE